MITDEMAAASLNAYREYIARKTMEQSELLTHLLCGDDKPSTPWTRLTWRLSIYRHRISDAWLVLTGQAEKG